jgi:hypothetical protein
MNYELDKNRDKLKEAIVRTVAYFNIFSFPLTSFEVWKFMHGGSATLAEALEILDSGELDYAMEKKNGFYFLYGREDIIWTRMARYNHTARKFRRALRMAKIFAFIPWIKMIAVVNIIGPHNLRDGSDIDLFIVTEKKRVWLARFFTAAVTQLMGLRPKKDDIRDKICLSFFISEEAKNLKRLTLGDNKADIYFIYWLAGMAPIYDRGGSYDELIKANGWLNKYLPNWRPANIVRRRRASPWLPWLFEAFIDAIFGRFERYFKKLQIKLMPQKIKIIANKDTRVVINDKVIKLHINDRREMYREMFEEAVE